MLKFILLYNDFMEAFIKNQTLLVESLDSKLSSERSSVLGPMII